MTAHVMAIAAVMMLALAQDQQQDQTVPAGDEQEATQRGTQCGLVYEQARSAGEEWYMGCVERSNSTVFKAFVLLGCEAGKMAQMEGARQAYTQCLGQ